MSKNEIYTLIVMYIEKYVLFCIFIKKNQQKERE